MSKRIFTIALLEDKDYLKLHKQFPNIEEKDLHNSLGFADKESGEAYIRKTSVEDVDMAVVQHEIQELTSKSSEHEDETGIRWFSLSNIFKKAKRIFVPESKGTRGGILGSLGALALAPFTGGASLAYLPLAGTAGGAIGGAQEGDILGGALKGFGIGTLGTVGAGAIQGATAAKAGFLSKAGGAISGAGGAAGLPGFGEGGKLAALGGTKVAPALAGGPLATYARGGSVLGRSLVGGAAPAAGFGAGAPSWVPGAISAAGRIATAGPLAPTLGAGPRITPTPSGLPPTPTPGVGVPGVGEAAPKPTFMERAKDLITPKNILGAGALLGAGAVPSPEFQMPSSIEDIRQRILADEGGLTQLGREAQTELSSILTTPAAELYPTAGDAYYDAALRRTRENYERAQEELDKVYNRAGVFGTGEHSAAKAELRENLARTESSLAAEVEQRRFELARTAKYTAIQDALGVDRAVMDDLIGLSGLDVATAAQMYGAEMADITSIREALGTLGAELLVRGTTGAGTQPKININLGQ